MAQPETLDLYKSRLYKDRYDNDRDLLIQIIPLFVQLKESNPSNYHIYKSVLCSENGFEVLSIINKFGATSHLEITNLTGISQPSANYNLQKLIQMGFVQVRPILNDPQIKGKFRPFNIYHIVGVEPHKVVDAIHRFKRLLLKEKLTGKAYDAYDQIEDLARQVLDRYGTRPTEENYCRILVENGIRTQKEWDVFIPKLVKAIREAS